jgi:hypothetical protein
VLITFSLLSPSVLFLKLHRPSTFAPPSSVQSHPIIRMTSTPQGASPDHHDGDELAHTQPGPAPVGTVIARLSLFSLMPPIQLDVLFFDLFVLCCTGTAGDDVATTKRGRGRPKGSKNKNNKSTAATATASATGAESPEGASKKKRGRPPKVSLHFSYYFTLPPPLRVLLTASQG